MLLTQGQWEAIERVERVDVHFSNFFWLRYRTEEQERKQERKQADEQEY